MPVHTFPSGRTVTWRGGGAYAAGPDGVLCVHYNGDLVVYETSPGWDDANGYHGAVKNPAGSTERNAYGFDRRLSMTGLRDRLPIEMRSGDVVLFATSQPLASMSSGEWTPTGYSNNNSRSVIRNMDAMVAVDWRPSASTPSVSLTPPIIGNNALVRGLRALDVGGLGIPQALLDLSKLPSEIDLTAIAATLSINVTAFDTLKANLETIFGSFMGDIYSGWSTDTATPGMQHPGYGTALAACVSQALLILASTRYTTAQKQTLAVSMSQAGLHLIGAMLDGRVMYANGGHCQGRKALMCLFGLLTGIDEFLFLGDGFGSVLREDVCYRDITWTLGGAADEPWVAGWAYNSTGSSNMNGDLLASAPSTWGNPSVWPTWAALMQAYMPPTIGADLGCALFFTLAGAPRAWGVAATTFAEQWMTEDAATTPVAVAMAAVGLDFAATSPAWGEDYGYDPYIEGFSSEAWKAHYPATFDFGLSAPGPHPGVEGARI